MELTPEQAVKNGAEWLDKVYPEWWMKVDVGKMDMDSTVTCICGQVFGWQDEIDNLESGIWYYGWQTQYSYVGSSCWMGFHAIIDIATNAPGFQAEHWSDTHGFSGYDSIYNPLWVTEIKCRADIGLVD